MKIRQSKLFVLMMAFALLLVACGADSSFLRVNNTSSAEICEVNISPNSAETWGPNQLDGDTIPAGTEYEISDIDPGVYDLRFVPCDQSSFEITEDSAIDLTDNIEYTLFDL